MPYKGELDSMYEPVWRTRHELGMAVLVRDYFRTLSEGQLKDITRHDQTTWDIVNADAKKDEIAQANSRLNQQVEARIHQGPEAMPQADASVIYANDFLKSGVPVILVNKVLVDDAKQWPPMRILNMEENELVWAGARRSNASIQSVMAELHDNRKKDPAWKHIEDRVNLAPGFQRMRAVNGLFEQDLEYRSREEKNASRSGVPNLPETPGKPPAIITPQPGVWWNARFVYNDRVTEQQAIQARIGKQLDGVPMIDADDLTDPWRFRRKVPSASGVDGGLSWQKGQAVPVSDLHGVRDDRSPERGCGGVAIPVSNAGGSSPRDRRCGGVSVETLSRPMDGGDVPGRGYESTSQPRPSGHLASDLQVRTTQARDANAELRQGSVRSIPNGAIFRDTGNEVCDETIHVSGGGVVGRVRSAVQAVSGTQAQVQSEASQRDGASNNLEQSLRRSLDNNVEPAAVFHSSGALSGRVSQQGSGEKHWRGATPIDEELRNGGEVLGGRVDYKGGGTSRHEIPGEYLVENAGGVQADVLRHGRRRESATSDDPACHSGSRVEEASRRTHAAARPSEQPNISAVAQAQPRNEFKQKQSVVRSSSVPLSERLRSASQDEPDAISSARAEDDASDDNYSRRTSRSATAGDSGDDATTPDGDGSIKRRHGATSVGAISGESTAGESRRAAISAHGDSRYEQRGNDGGERRHERGTTGTGERSASCRDVDIGAPDDDPMRRSPSPSSSMDGKEKHGDTYVHRDTHDEDDDALNHVKFGERMFFQKAIDAVKPFSGYDHDVDIDTWLAGYSNALEAYGIPFDIGARFIPLKLVGIAKQWLISGQLKKVKKKTWENVTKALRERFSVADHVHERIASYTSRVMRSNERPSDYAEDLYRLRGVAFGEMAEAKVSDDELIHRVIYTLPAYFQYRLRCRPYKNWVQFVGEVRMLEKVQALEVQRTRSVSHSEEQSTS